MADTLLYGLFVAAVCVVAGGAAYLLGLVLDVVLAYVARRLGVDPDEEARRG